MTPNQLKNKAKMLSEKFSEDLEALFEDEGVTAELDDSEIFWLMKTAIDAAKDVSTQVELEA